MNCAEFQEIVHDLARDADIEHPTRRDALAHADLCPRCDERLAEAQSLTIALRSLAAKDGAAEAGSHVELGLVEAFRQRQNRAARPKISWQWGFAGAASLAALVLLSVLVLRHPVVSPPTQGDGASASATQPSSVSRASGGSSIPADAASADADSEYATSFVSLPFTDGLAPAGDEIIVRQSVPPSALANFGLRVSEGGTGENVLADFVVDEDGTPRAVRVVE
jgi:hypothetical protein